MADLNVNSIGDASGGTTTSINGYTPTVSNMAGRNRIINGDMRIDQRNAGASVSGYFSYAVDRFNVGKNAGETAAFTQQRDTSAPAGFNNSLKFTVTTAQTSFTASQRVDIRQRIEGFNVADLNFGTANASPITLSFWVRSSLTGTFGGSISNGAYNRAYPYSYTINVADTWEYKTITIQGDTTGTWATDNSNGMAVTWCLGGGSSALGTAGAWVSSSVFGVTGQVNLVGTSGATFYITGVQLESGSVATPFEHRQYGQELALCQRYFEIQHFCATGYGNGSNGILFTTPFSATKRAIPTMTDVGLSYGGYTVGSINVNANPTFVGGFTTSLSSVLEIGVASALVRCQTLLTASAEL